MKKAILLTLLFIQSYSVIHAQLPSSGTYVWKAADEPKIFNNKLQLSFVQGSNGFPQYGTVLAGGGYNTTQDGAVFQLYFPYSEVYGGNAPKLRLGRYNNAGWSNWETFFTSANANKSTIDWSSKTLFVNDKIGVGTTTPVSTLHVLEFNNSAPAALFQNGGGSGEGIQIKAGAGGSDYKIIDAMTWAGVSRFSVRGDGSVLIGNSATPAGYKLYVQSGILTEKVKVAVKTSANWADYVFDKKYKLPSLTEVECYIKVNNHLPNIPSAEEVKKEGIDLGEMDAKLLAKIEELTLYIIEMNKKTAALEMKVKAIEKSLNNDK